MAKTRLFTKPVNQHYHLKNILNFFQTYPAFFLLPLLDQDLFNSNYKKDLAIKNEEFNKLFYDIVQATKFEPSLGPAVIYSEPVKFNQYFKLALSKYLVALVGARYSTNQQLAGIAIGDTTQLENFLTDPKHEEIYKFFYRELCLFKWESSLAKAAMRFNEDPKSAHVHEKVNKAFLQHFDLIDHTAPSYLETVRQKIAAIPLNQPCNEFRQQIFYIVNEATLNDLNPLVLAESYPQYQASNNLQAFNKQAFAHKVVGELKKIDKAMHPGNFILEVDRVFTETLDHALEHAEKKMRRLHSRSEAVSPSSQESEEDDRSERKKKKYSYR